MLAGYDFFFHNWHFHFDYAVISRGPELDSCEVLARSLARSVKSFLINLNQTAQA
jgi:hypothetical protein